MLKDPTLEEAKKILEEYPYEEDYMQEYYHQWFAPGFGMDDNSCELAYYWYQCKKLVDNETPIPEINK